MAKKKKELTQTEKEAEWQKEKEELIEHLQRLQAEFENYKKRVEKEKQALIQYANANLIKDMLPILDSFDAALKHQDNQEELKSGLILIHKQLTDLLKKYGLEKINALNCEFDPYKHEVLMKEESEQDNKVLEEFQPGYTLNNCVIRCSKVKIGKKKEEQKNENNQEHKKE